MALPASGAISLGDVQTEFGGSNPISISEYYSADTGVPASGTISLSDFHGTSNTDVTPDTMTWSPVNLGPGDMTTTDTITGINQTISVEFQALIVHGTVDYRINGGSWVLNFATTDVNLSNNDTIDIRFNDSQQSGSSGLNGSITLKNNDDGDALLASISVSSYDAGL